MTTSVALIGANGHGRMHRRHLTSLQETDTVRLVALADVRPIEPDPAGVAVFTDYRELLAATRPEVVVICTPPHTHLPIARDAFAAGCDVLLEKPPVRTLAEHHSLLTAARAARAACQVGFQALGSTASARFGAAIGGGDLGRIGGLAAVGSWQRDDAYYARAPWAGRRSVGGRPVVDGALVNPLAHALMQALDAAAVAGAGAPARIEVERYRTREIEVDDTTFARITFAGGLRLIAAVTLAGEEFIPGEVIADGSAGRAVLEYPTDRLALPGDPEPVAVPGRVDLLENLLAHRSDAQVALIAPLERTAAFTAVLESLTALALPLPELLDEPYVESRGAGAGRVQVIRGVNAVLRQSARTGRLPSESGVAWAVPPYSAPVPPI
jgi:predicted dehydrogenase